MKKKLLKIYSLLYDHFGPQHWWPGSTPFEVMVGAILTQNTNWGNVEKAIGNLKRARVLSPGKILDISNSKLERLIRPTGYFRQKAKKVKAFVRYFTKNYQGSVSRMKKRPLAGLRAELLAVHGIGPETADSMLLYALDKSTFVVDAYTRRIGQRVGIFRFDDYHQIKDFFEHNLPRSRKLYNEYHALIVALGKYFCKPRPVCKGCPLSRVCAFN
jgi:endonuclease-3 related protein